MTPHVSWRLVAPADVLSALKTLGRLARTDRRIHYRGEDDPETLLGWGFSELDLAEGSSGRDARMHASHAVGHAKKAVDCLLDAYLERDFLDIRMRTRAPFLAKVAILRERLGPVFPWRLISAAVAKPRNASEHDGKAPSIEEAGVAIEAARAVVHSLSAAADPLRGPAIAGWFTGGMSVGRWGRHVYVTKFPPHFAWVWRCHDGVPRAAVGVASADDAAEVCYADLRAFTREHHLDLLRTWDAFGSGWFEGEPAVQERLKLTGLDQPR